MKTLVMIVLFALAVVACDRVVDLTPDAREAIPDGPHGVPDAALPDAGLDAAPLPDAVPVFDASTLD